MKKALIIVSLFLFCFSILNARDTGTIWVAGFINEGDSADDNINPILSKSLIDFLSLIPNQPILPYETTELLWEEADFLDGDTLIEDELYLTALSYDAKTVVIGSYEINNRTESISISFSVYDVVTGELIITRDYEGPSGMKYSIPSMK